MPSSPQAQRCLALALFAMLMPGLAGALADTVSVPVGFVRRVVAQGQAAPVSNPFSDSVPVFATDGLAQTLAAGVADGDLLSLWTGRAFNAYTCAAGQWNITGSQTRVPEGRLENTAGSGCMLTRSNPGTLDVRFAGCVRTEATTAVTVPAGSWKLMANPYPTETFLADLQVAGAADGDQARLWDTQTQQWQLFAVINGAWSGTGSSSVSAAPGTSFLFYNAATSAKTLLFTKP